MGLFDSIGKAFSSAANAVAGAVSGGISNIGKSVEKGLGGLQGIVDTFSKLAGPALQIGATLFGGPLGGILGGGIGSLLGKMAGFGALPLPGNLPFGQIGDILKQGLGGILGGLGGIVGGGAGGANPLGQIGGMIGKVVGTIQDIIGKLTGKTEPAKPGGIMGMLQQILDELKKQGGTHTAGPVAGGGGTPATTTPGGVGSTGGTGGTTGGGQVTGNAGDPVMDAAFKAYDQMGSIESQIANLNPDSKDYQKNLMMLQQKMANAQQMIATLSNIMKMKHDMAMSVIGNLRA